MHQRSATVTAIRETALLAGLVLTEDRIRELVPLLQKQLDAVQSLDAILVASGVGVPEVAADAQPLQSQL
jgi:hypothetical protein